MVHERASAQMDAEAGLPSPVVAVGTEPIRRRSRVRICVPARVSRITKPNGTIANPGKGIQLWFPKQSSDACFHLNPERGRLEPEHAYGWFGSWAPSGSAGRKVGEAL